MQQKGRIYAELQGTEQPSTHIRLQRRIQREGAEGYAHPLDANITPEEIDYINAHGTSTRLNDSAETIAVKKCSKNTYNLCINSSKSVIGHLIAASGPEFVLQY
jgi:3-oxoacyl-[acyl-carrier-protein] synthase II